MKAIEAFYINTGDEPTIYDLANTNGDDIVDREEFIRLWERPLTWKDIKPMKDDGSVDWQMAFDKFDYNGDNLLDSVELKTGMQMDEYDFETNMAIVAKAKDFAGEDMKLDFDEYI